MSAEIARAFCVRMMTDEDFRAALAGVRETAEIDKIMADEKYSFTKDDLNKVVGEVVGHKLENWSAASMRSRWLPAIRTPARS